MKRHKIVLKHNLTLQPDGKWRLQIWVSDTDYVTENIFVYQRKPDMPYESSSRDVFVNIAQPADLAEYPADEPNDTFPFFRKSYMDVVIEDPLLVEETMGNVCSDVEDLCVALDRIQ